MNILTTYTLKYLRLNKKRTAVTILGAILSSALISGVLMLGMSFQQVMIDGHPGVHIRRQRSDGTPLNTVVWSTPDRVFALVTMRDPGEALQMANSVR